MTNRTFIRSRLTAIVLAAASVAALAGAAQAQDQRIAVGDLSQPGQGADDVRLLRRQRLPPRPGRRL